MHYIFWVIAVFVLSILGLLAGKHYFTDPEASYREEVYSQFMQDGHLDRNELRTMLNKLPDSLHRDLELGAMCYKSGGLRAPDTIPFTCPTCGEKTIYSEKQSYSRKHYLTR
ncbi:MAG: hypothetical protein GY757_56925, partial [bacterium]|nr:hypothetical protein [bacterium]